MAGWLEPEEIFETVGPAACQAIVTLSQHREREAKVGQDSNQQIKG